MTLFDAPHQVERRGPEYTTVSFYAHGAPKPQGSKRAFVHQGRAVMTESNKAGHRDWRATVTSAALDAMGDDQPLLEGPLRVRLVFALPRPKSHPKTRRTWPIARPDADKLARACLDSMTHVIYRDDSQIVDLHVVKIWAEVDTPAGAGVAITVIALTPQDDPA